MFAILISFSVLGAECNWNTTPTINCDVTTNITITGTHIIANVSLKNNVYMNLNNAFITTNTSWTFVVNGVGINHMFKIDGNDVTIDGNSNSMISGLEDCDNNLGTTAVDVSGTYNRPVLKNLNMLNHESPIRYGNAVYGMIENNIINKTGDCHPTIYGTGNHTLITNNDIAGSVWFFGGETNLSGNRDLDVEDSDCEDEMCCERNHFGFSNVASWESNKYWYGKITDNTFSTCGNVGNSQIKFYTGNELNISNNENINVILYPSTGTYGNEYYLNNTGYLYLALPPEERPVLCLDGLHNKYSKLGIYHEGNWKVSDFVCAGETFMNDTSITIQYSNVSFNCDGVTINDLENSGYLPLQIWGDVKGGYEFSTHDNVSVENCNLWNGWGGAVGIYTRNGNVMTNINLKDISTISTGKSIEGFGVDGLSIDNITGTDCGAGISLFDGNDLGSDAPTSNVVLNNSYFSGGGCSGVNSYFNRVDTLTITNTNFDSSADSGLIFEALTDNIDVHNNIVVGETILGGGSDGVFYNNNIQNLRMYDGNVDICNGGIGNTMQQILFGTGNVDYVFDSSCNPLYLPEGIRIYAENVTGDPSDFTYNINGNGVNVTGTNQYGFRTISSPDFKVTNSTIENFMLSGYTTSFNFGSATENNLIKDSIVTSNYTDFGTGNTFSNITWLCDSNWSCNGYETCVEPMVNANCNSVTDLNTCGEIYSGDYSEFTPQTCSYPPPITGYTPYHASSDIAGVVVDFIVELGIHIIAFVGLIALVLLGMWLMAVL